MKKGILSICLSMLFIQASGETVISIEECVGLARANYPEIAKLDIIRITEKCDLSNASLSWLPAVTLGAWGGWSNQNTDFDDLFLNASDEGSVNYYKQLIKRNLIIPSPTPWKYSGGVEVRQTIYDGGMSSAAKSEARAMAELMESETRVSIDAVEKRVEELFFSILLLTERRKQMDLKMEVLERNRNKMEEMKISGNSSVLSVKMMNAEIISLGQQVSVLEDNLAVYLQALSLFIGRDASVLELQTPKMPDSGGRSVYDTPSMRMLDSRLKVARAKQEMLDASLRPRLAFVGNLSYGYPGSNFFRSLVNHNPVFDANLGVKLVWNLTPFYTRKNNTVKIENEIRFLAIEKESLIFNTRVESTSLNTRIARMEKTLKQDEELLALRTEIRQVEEARLESGDIDTDTFLNKVSEESEAALAKSVHTIELLQYHYQCRHNGFVAL